MTERCCNFGFFIDLLVSRNAFTRGNPEEGDRGLRGNPEERRMWIRETSGCVEEASAMEERTASEFDMIRIR